MPSLIQINNRHSRHSRHSRHNRLRHFLRKPHTRKVRPSYRTRTNKNISKTDNATKIEINKELQNMPLSNQTSKMENILEQKTFSLFDNDTTLQKPISSYVNYEQDGNKITIQPIDSKGQMNFRKLYENYYENVAEDNIEFVKQQDSYVFTIDSNIPFTDID